MEVTCPKCKLVIALDNTRTADPGCCPNCNTPLTLSSPSESNKPANSGDLFESILAEIHEKKEETQIKKETRSGATVAPKSSSSEYHTPVGHEESEVPESRYATILTVGILLVLVAAGLAFYYVRKTIRSDAVSSALQRIEPKKTGLQELLRSAEKDRADKQYGRARESYREAETQGSAVLERFERETDGIARDELLEKTNEVKAELAALLKQAQDGLNADEVKFGAAGHIPYKGLWVTPEQYQKLFEEEMLAQGRKFHEGRWLNEEEYHTAIGDTYYNGRWMSKREYADALRKTPVSPVLPPPDDTRRIKPQERQGLKPLAGTFDPSVPQWILDDFERGLEWANVTNWGRNNPNVALLSIEEGSKRLKVELPGGEENTKDKYVIMRLIGQDFSSRSRISMDIENNCSAPVYIAIALKTDTYYESRQPPLKVGNNRGVMFDLRAGDFKCAASNWNFSAQIKKLDSLSEIYILIYYNGAGTLYFDDIVASGG